MLNIPVILGTAREGRQSEKAANYMVREAMKAGCETELLDVRDYRIGATDKKENDPKAKKLAEKIDKADALIIVSPEYNHGYPGELKMMLDMLYLQYFNKPVGFCGVSISPFGGVRVVEQLRLVAAELHMVSIRSALYFSRIQDFFDEKGEPVDKTCPAQTKIFLDELIWYGDALKTKRMNR